MTHDELIDELRKQGTYVLFYTTVSEMKDFIPNTTDEDIKRELDWLEKNYSDHQDFYTALEMMQHRIETNRTR